ncbi:hypothetical protein BWI17_08245 [Betaproteobacteria bacterium GR16-43]|nr:hypothetical protein BWI17_08245 [Betaproteobacteria bacterium GR16-43]
MRIALGALLFTATALQAQDYEREKRWADEVAPGVVVGDAVWIEASSGRKFLGLYAPVKDAKAALVIVHGIGVHPDHGLIGILRSKLTDLGLTTLSIQMPVLGADAKGEDYSAVFPDAIDRIARAGAWLRERTPATLVLVTHSMGSAMGNAYLEAKPAAPFGPWVCLGRSGAFLPGGVALRRAVLDVEGERDLPAVLAGAPSRMAALAAPRSRQLAISGADHFYARQEGELAAAIADWLKGALR